jgi:ketosteroid isomerase-like protein
MKLITIIISLLVSGFTYAGHHEKTTSAQNIATATQFMQTVLAEPVIAKALLHNEFDFEFMGVSQLSNVMYDKETYFSKWMVTVGELIPTGFRKLDVVDAIGDDKAVALMVEGDADGINGLYANKYVFVFKFSDGKIISLREYTSDLLVETRLYKQKLVADD